MNNSFFKNKNLIYMSRQEWQYNYTNASCFGNHCEHMLRSFKVNILDYFIFESVFFDVQRAIYRLLLLNK